MEDKFEAGACILIRQGCDLQSCKNSLSALGLTDPEMLRLLALVPVACGRRIFLNAKPAPKYADHYIVTNNGRTRIEVPYATCEVYAAIERAVDKADLASTALLGALCGETRAINDCLNQLQQAGKPVDCGRVHLEPTEVLF